MTLCLTRRSIWTSLFLIGAFLVLQVTTKAADGLPWKPDYSTPEGTVLTQCMAQNLPEGRREIMGRAYIDGESLPDIMLRQDRVMCRVVEVKPVHDAVDPSMVVPDMAQVILEEWDPVAGYSEKNIFRRWFSVRNVGEEWKIIEWGVAYDADNPPDDILVCKGWRFWGLPVVSSPVVAVCNFLYDLSVSDYKRLDVYLAPDASKPKGLWTDVAQVESVQPAFLARDTTAKDLAALDEAELVVSGLYDAAHEDQFWNLHRFKVRRFGEEWKIDYIEYLGRRPNPTGEGK